MFLLQPPHVINHVKWRKAQHCQDSEGDLMELKIECFVVMQSILFHRHLLTFTMPSNRTFSFWARCRLTMKAVSILSKLPDSRNCVEKFWLVFVVLKMSGSLRQFCTHACLSSTPQFFYSGLYIGLSTVHWRLGVKIVFIFHF